MSAKKDQSALRNITEDRRSHVQGAGSLKSRQKSYPGGRSGGVTAIACQVEVALN